MRSIYHLNMDTDIPKSRFRRTENNYCLFIQINNERYDDEWFYEWKSGDFIGCNFNGTTMFYEVKEVREDEIFLVFSTMILCHTNEGAVWVDILEDKRYPRI